MLHLLWNHPSSAEEKNPACNSSEYMYISLLHRTLQIVHEVNFCHPSLDIGAVQIRVQHHNGKSQNKNCIHHTFLIRRVTANILLSKILKPHQLTTYVSTQSNPILLCLHLSLLQFSKTSNVCAFFNFWLFVVISSI